MINNNQFTILSIETPNKLDKYFNGPNSLADSLNVLVSNILFSKANIESFTMSNLVVNFSSVLFADSICFTLALFDLTIRLPFLSVNWVTEPLDKVPFKSANDCFSLIMLSRVCSYSFFLVSRAVICCVTIPSLLAVDWYAFERYPYIPIDVIKTNTTAAVTRYVLKALLIEFQY